MKKLFALILLILLVFKFNFGQGLIKHQKTISISASQVRPDDTKMYDLNKAEEAYAFIKEKVLQDVEVIRGDKVSDSLFSNFIKDDLRHSAIIFVRHGFNPTALTTNLTKADLKKLKNDIDLAVDKVPLSDSIDAINNFLIGLKYKNTFTKSDYKSHAEYLSDPAKRKFFLKDSSTINSVLENPDIKKLMIELLDAEKVRLQNANNYFESFIKSDKPSFIENKNIIKTVLHKKGEKYSDYLLETKQIMIVILGGAGDLQKGEVSIKNNKSFFAQSFDDLKAFVSLNKSVGGDTALPCKIIILESSKIKPPSEIFIKDSSIKEDISFTIHERNTASFQVGVVNNKFQFNNFSISNGNLVIKPDSSQKANWKSNLYALLELHIPRDIDNFRPIYKTLFKADSNRTFGQWVYDVTLSRIGIYGGFKLSDDPLSKIHAGFNYAISKELYVNFGWTWTNDVVPQVTKIGDIISLGDALKYAKRKYSKGEFSWGLSFAPSVLIETLGLKKDTKKAIAEK